MYSCRSTSSKVSPVALSKDNDLKENRLLFKLNLFLLSYPHILSLPPKGAGSPAKKPVSPGFFAWVCVGTVLLCLSPLFLFRTRGQTQKDRPLKSKTPPCTNTYRGALLFRETWGRFFCFRPHCSCSGQGDRNERTVPLNHIRRRWA